MRLPKSAAIVLTGAVLVGASTSPAHAVIEPTAYEFAGKQVSLATGATGGPDLRAGLYRTTLPNDGSPRSFQINRNQMRTFVASVLTYEKNATNFLLGDDHETTVKFTNAKGDDCGEQSEELPEGEPAGIVITNLGVDDDTELSRAGYLSSDCRESTTLTATITHTGSPANASTDAEILLTDEPKGTGETGAGASDAETTMIKAPVTEPKDEVEPGTGFSTAATLTPGTYPVKLTVGSRIFYRVRLEWGQRLAATMSVPAKDSNFGSPVALEATISTWSPQRVFLDTQPKDYEYGREASLPANSSEVNEIGSYTAAVRWANRSASASSKGEVGYEALPWTTVPGWYYVSVNTQPKTPVSDSTPLPDSAPTVPAQLSIAVVGAAQPGPKLVSAGGQSVAAPASGQMSVGSGTSVSKPFPWAKAGLTGFAVLAAAAAVVWALRRKAA